MTIVEDPQRLDILAHLDTRERADLGRLGRSRVSNVMVVSPRGRSSPDDKAVWVRSAYGSYRSAFQRFIRDTYGPVDFTEFRHYDVDHLLNRGRAPSSSDFIRLEAVLSEVNQAWGAIFEKASGGENLRCRRNMSFMICAKLGNVMPATSSRDTSGLKRLESFFRAHGLNEPTLKDGLTQMLEFVEGLPA